MVVLRSLELMNKQMAVLRVIVCLLLLSVPFPAHPQQPEKIPRIGYLTSFGTPSARQVEAFRQGMKEIGYIEGKNIVINYRYPKGNPESTPELVAELIQLKTDIFVAADPTAIRAAKQATKTIPIVMLTNQDPVVTGLVESLARPGGNVTGITRLTRELSGKRLGLLKEAVPRITRVGVLWVRPTSLGTGNAFKNHQTAATALKLELESLQVSRPNPDLDGAFETATKSHVNALVVVSNAVLLPYSKQIAGLANQKRLPSLCETTQYADAGCMMSYATNDAASYRRVAYYVDKILKGAKPGDLPVEQAADFEFVINLKTARQIGLNIPQSVLFRADRLIK
jgi:putative tryptophan/tyrosine transport system substrate-binding protein